MTNYEVVKAMGMNELAGFLASITTSRGLSGAKAYYMGNIIKYLYRYPKKGTLLSDLAKAEEYTKFLRELFMEDGGKA